MLSIQIIQLDGKIYSEEYLWMQITTNPIKLPKILSRLSSAYLARVKMKEILDKDLVSVPVGYDDNLERIINMVWYYGFNEFESSRPAKELNKDLINIGVANTFPTILTFRNEEGLKIEVLYVGEYTTSIELIHQISCAIASQSGMFVKHPALYTKES